MMKILDLMSNIISPPVCMSCRKRLSLLSNAKFCYKCSMSYKRVGEHTCDSCGKPIPKNSDRLCVNCKLRKVYFNQSISRYIYDGCIKSAIRNMKFRNQKWIANEFGDMLLKTVREKYDDISFDIIICIPLSNSKMYERGFNQTREIADEISKGINVPIAEKILYKKDNVKTQSGLSAKERIENVKNAYFIKHPERVCDKTILLIDDVFTTGATVNECSKILKKAGALAVYVATVATTSRNE